MKENLTVERRAKRINVNCAGVMAAYYTGFAAAGGYTVVYLTHLGMNNSQIGLTNSLISALAIALQLFLGDFSDKHRSFALKKIISLVLLAAICAAGVLHFLPIPLAMMMAVYAVLNACVNSIGSLCNSTMMQFLNAGIPVTYGWPRGVGSIGYSASAWVLGIVLEKYSPRILMPVFIVLAALAILLVLLLPTPEKVLREAGSAVNTPEPEKKEKGGNSYITMLKGNKTLRLFVLALILVAMGVTAGSSFLMRNVERLGGSTSQYGLACFLQSGVELPMMILSGHILKKWKPNQLMIFSFVCFGIKMLLLTVAGSMLLIYIAMAFSIFCYGIYGFAAVYFSNEIAGADEKTKAQSLLSLCFSGGIGGILGNALSGMLIDRIGLTPTMFIGCVITFLGAGVMFLCSRQYKHKRSEHPVDAVTEE